MRFSSSYLLAVVLPAALAATAVAACSSTPRGTFDDPINGDAGDAGTSLPTDGGPKPPAFTDASLDAAKPGGPSEVFGHSGKVLYRLDPDTKSVQVIGTFSGCNEGSEQVIDIALDEASNMYGTTYTGLFRIDKATARCTRVTSSTGKDFPNSLSFVPKGTLDPADEALVGYVADEYVRIDPANGNITTIGKLGNTQLRSSGDIVSVIGGPTYLTVKSTGASGQCAASDCLVEIDPKTGAITKNWGALNARVDVFGVAFWAGSIYGFTKAGTLFQVEIKGGALTLNEITIPQRPTDLSFFGAGSTTSAPTQPK
ncbi:MAG TPA: hypothetical protein PLR99_09090 [Polyangiaceae bacterium]|nr:hypothetical protein [Polyangiaceae bacterium]